MPLPNDRITQRLRAVDNFPVSIRDRAEKRPVSVGFGVHVPSDRPSSFLRIQCPGSIGLGVQFASEYADVACDAVKAAMQTRWCIDKLINPELEDRYGQSLNYGIGVGQGEIHVGKSGVAGDDNFQDLIWVGWAVYHAVAYGDRATKPKSLWISKNIFKSIKGRDKMVQSKGENMWVWKDESFSFGTFRVYKTSYRWSLA